MTGNGSDRARFGPFEVDLHTRELWKFGTRLKLVGQPFEILTVLLRRPGELVTREELRNQLWPADTFVDFNHGLNAAVNKLREALSDSAENPRYIETLPRRGYRFVATVEWIEARPASSPISPVAVAPEISAEVLPKGPQAALAAQAEPAASCGIATNTIHPSGIHPRTWSRRAVGAVVFVVLLIAGAFLLRGVSGYGAPTRSALQRTRTLTAVTGTASPAFSPDGNRVALFHEGATSEESGIFTTVIGSDQLVPLTHDEGDCCPAWSPDGRFIVFSRYANKLHSLYVVPADGGAEQKRNAEKVLTTKSAAYTPTVSVSERKLDTGGVLPSHGESSWSPDGKSIAFVGPAGISLFFLEDSSVRRITSAPPMSQDWGPSFSPDGQQVLFVRSREIGSPDELWAVPTAGGEPVRTLAERGR